MNLILKQILIAVVISILSMVFLRVNFWVMFIIVNIAFLSRSFLTPRSASSSNEKKTSSFDKKDEDIIDLNK